MQTMLITGGTVFVSRFAAEYFADKYNVFVLNRNSRPQSDKVTLIEADRHHIGNRLRNQHFDVILDITAYDAQDVEDLLDAVGSFDDYILISSSAVYPETARQPFAEETQVGSNRYWGSYGTNKIQSEQALLKRVPGAYILRPPYLYGPGNNVYREAFVFDCAMSGRRFYLPGEGEMQLQFYHTEDLCNCINFLIKNHPNQHVLNVGNAKTISIREWVSLCYKIAGCEPKYVQVSREVPQRSYFPFYDYAYRLDVKKLHDLLPEEKPLILGLTECYQWYQTNADLVVRKLLIAYIDSNLRKMKITDRRFPIRDSFLLTDFPLQPSVPVPADRGRRSSSCRR